MATTSADTDTHHATRERKRCWWGIGHRSKELRALVVSAILRPLNQAASFDILFDMASKHAL